MLKQFLIFITASVITTSAMANDPLIKLVVPFAPGGPADRVARMIQRDMKDAGRIVVVDNRPGGGGAIAANALAQAPKNETVLMIVGTVLNIAANPATYDKLDLQPVAEIGHAPMAIVVPGNSSIKNFKDFLNADTAQSITYANAGKASLSYLAGEALRHNMRKNLISVSYPNAPKMMIDLLAGRVDFGIMHVVDVLPYLDQQLVPIAVLTESRLSAFPNIPTVREFNIQDGIFSSHYILVSNATTNASDIALVQTTLTRVLNDSTLNKAYRDEGLRIAPGNKALDSKWLTREVNRVRELAKKINLQSE